MPITRAFGIRSAIERDLSDQVAGLPSAFTLPSASVSDSLRVYINGMKARRGDNLLNISATGFSLSYSPLAGETITVLYIPL